MDKYQKQALQVAKEVVIKFIEVGRISPANFGQNFDVIFKDVMRTVTGVTAGDGSREAELAMRDGMDDGMEEDTDDAPERSE